MFIGRLFIWVFHFFFFPFYFSSDFRFFSFHFCAFRFASDRCTLPQQMQNSKNADTLFCLAPLSLLFFFATLSLFLFLFSLLAIYLFFLTLRTIKTRCTICRMYPTRLLAENCGLMQAAKKKRSKNASLALDSSMYKQFGTGFVTGE
jgi:hypothetical protein